MLGDSGEVTDQVLNKNAFCLTLYLTYCCSLFCCRDIKPQMYQYHDLNVSRSYDVMCHVPIRLTLSGFL